jgi:hypothetical protein
MCTSGVSLLLARKDYALTRRGCAASSRAARSLDHVFYRLMCMLDSDIFLMCTLDSNL